MKQCPRCAAQITSKMKKCEKCGLPLDSVDFSDEFEKQELENQNKKAAKKAEKRAKKLARKQELKEKRERESVSNTDFSKYASNVEHEEEPEEVAPKKGLFGLKKKKKNKQEKPNFEIDENGEFYIDTADVEIVGAETGKLIEEQHAKSYSVKKARGDYREPKIKWWEIYKLADRAFARRKIKKEVNKAAKIKPEFIKKSSLLTRAIFLGWCGAHNFYAKNTKKGWTSIICLILWMGIAFFAPFIPFLSKIQISVGGCAGFIVLFIWFGDAFSIAFNSFKYRLQREKFIFSLNIETRAKLGEKYIDYELYKKPWWFRFKVWCQKKKRNYDEWKHERRQRLIEREKAKLAASEEKAKIDAEIARHDAMEDAEIEKQKQEERAKLIMDEGMVAELKSFGNEDTKVLKAETAKNETEEVKEEKTPQKDKPKVKAKLTVKKSTKNKTKKK